MKVFNADIYQSKGALAKLAEEKLPGKVSYALAKLAREINSEWNVLENTRIGILRKHGTDTDGVIKVEEGSDAHKEFLKEWFDILKEEVELESERVTIPDSIEIEVAVLLPLVPFVVIE